MAGTGNPLQTIKSTVRFPPKIYILISFLGRFLDCRSNEFWAQLKTSPREPSVPIAGDVIISAFSYNMASPTVLTSVELTNLGPNQIDLDNYMLVRTGHSLSYSITYPK